MLAHAQLKVLPQKFFFDRCPCTKTPLNQQQHVSPAYKKMKHVKQIEFQFVQIQFVITMHLFLSSTQMIR